MTASPSPALTVTPRRSRVAVVLAVVLCLLLLSMSGCIALFLSGSKATVEAKGSASQFLSTLEQGDYRTAQTLLASQAEARRRLLASVMEPLQKQHGKAISHEGPQGWRTSTRNGTTQVRMAYLERFEKGQVPVEITCVEEGGKWAIADFTFR